MIKKITFKGTTIVATLVMMIFVGCGTTEQTKDATTDVTQKIENGKKMVETGQKIIKDSKDVTGGLKNALQNGVAMKCVETENNNTTWTTYTNGKNFRTYGMEGEKENNVVMKDDVTYTWVTGEKKGMKMDKKCIEDFQKDMNIPKDYSQIEIEEEFSVENLSRDEKDGNLQCSPTTEADFSIPSDVEFVDQCKIMKEQMQQLKAQMPNIPNISQ